MAGRTFTYRTSARIVSIITITTARYRVAETAGVALAAGQPRNLGDYDHDGYLDLFFRAT